MMRKEEEEEEELLFLHLPTSHSLPNGHNRLVRKNVNRVPCPGRGAYLHFIVVVVVIVVCPGERERGDL